MASLQLVLSWYLHQSELYQWSLQKIGQKPRCVDRTLGFPLSVESLPNYRCKTVIFIYLRRTKTNARNVEVSDCLFCLLLWPHWTKAKSVSGPKVVTTCPQSYFPAYSRLKVVVVDDDDDIYPISWYRADCANKVQYVRMKFRIHSDALHFISLQKGN